MITNIRNFHVLVGNKKKINGAEFFLINLPRISQTGNITDTASLWFKGGFW